MSFLNPTRAGLVAVAGLLLITMLAGCAAPVATPAVAQPAAPTAVPPTEAPAAPAATEAPTAIPPTEAPTAAPATEAPTAAPATEAPTAAPTEAPTAAPTEAPTAAPTEALLPATATVSFSQDILPLFNASCLKCHGGDDTKEGLSLKTYEDLMKGSVNGPVIVPGDPAASELVTQVARGKMPKRAAAWPEAQVKLLSDWVAAGAPNN